MDDFDISSDGYTPARTSNIPQRTSPVSGPYHPPRNEDEARYFGDAASAGNAEETRFQPLDPEEGRRADQTPAPEPFKGRPREPQPQQQEPEVAPETPAAPAQEPQPQKSRSESRRQRIEQLRRTEGRPNALVRFFTDERTRVGLGITLLMLMIFMIIAVFSHFSHGAADQSVVTNLTLDEIQRESAKVGNLAGNIGAWLSYVLLCDALGIGSLVIVPYLWILAMALFGVRKCNFWGTTFRCLLIAISASIVLGFFTYTWGTEIYWGGNHGHYVNKFLFDNTSWVGATIVSVFLIGIVCTVYLNELRLLWGRWQVAYERHKMQEELRRERRRELESLEAEEAQERRRRQAAARDAAQTTPAAEAAEAAETEQTATVSVSPARPDTAPAHRDVLVIDDSADHSHDTVSEADGAPVVTPDAKSIFVIDDDDDSPAPVSDPDFVINPTKEIEEADPNIQAPVHEMDGLYDHRAELPHYMFPTVELLEDRPSGAVIDLEEQQANKRLIESTLLNYKIPISRIEATVGPTVTLYEIVPAEGVRISQIKRLEDDIALSLKALGIRIIAPIPGKGTVGIEVPNNDPQTVSMRAVLNSRKYQECKMALPMAMGATIDNDIFIADMAKMPHLLVAGATGMGKSVGLNAIIASLLYKKHPSELKLVLIDPKMVEFSLYSKLERHFLAKLPNEEDAIITDMKKVIQTLNSLCVEMDDRYELLRDANVRSLEEYNKKFTERRLNANNGHRYLPYIVVIVDEFADLIMTQGKEVEQPIARIAQKARAVGIHMILATQRPSTNVITGLIKANFPGRIAFRVIQMVDSRTILDMPGANQLIGRGDMLFSHNGSMERVQCAFISTEEVEALTEFIDRQVGYEHAYYLPEFVPEEAEGGAIAGASMERDGLFNEAARFVVTRQMGSTSSLQRQFGIGYNRAGKLMDQMEAAGIVGPVNGAKPRAILMDIVTLESILGE